MLARRQELQRSPPAGSAQAGGAQAGAGSPGARPHACQEVRRASSRCPRAAGASPTSAQSTPHSRTVLSLASQQQWCPPPKRLDAALGAGCLHSDIPASPGNTDLLLTACCWLSLSFLQTWIAQFILVSDCLRVSLAIDTESEFVMKEGVGHNYLFKWD